MKDYKNKEAILQKSNLINEILIKIADNPEDEQAINEFIRIIK